MEKENGKYQSRFRGERSLVNQNFIIRKQKTQSRDINFFIDFQEAYNRIERKELFTAMAELGVNKQVVR